MHAIVSSTNIFYARNLIHWYLFEHLDQEQRNIKINWLNKKQKIMYDLDDV